MRFVFKRSMIWEHGDPVDHSSEEWVVKIPKDDEKRARRKLPDPGGGRVWILVRKAD